MPVELNFGPPPKYFLEENATPKQLFEYAKEFHEKFARKQPGSYPAGRFHCIPEEIHFSWQGDHYYFGLYRDDEVIREYGIYPDHLELGFSADKTSVQKTAGQHAYFISVCLRDVGITRLMQQGLLKSSGH